MPIGTAILGAGALSAGGGLLSGILGSGAARSAAQAQERSALAAIRAQMSMFNVIQGNLAPYRDLGALGVSALEGNWQNLTAPFQPTMKQLQQFPGYQFALQQGLKATDNSYAAQGLGIGGPKAWSGAAMKGRTNYAEGLASTTFQQAFQDYMAQQGQRFNMLSGLTGIGESAAGMTSAAGQATAGNVANLITGAGAAQAGGIVGGTNALLSGLSSVTGAGSNTALLLALQNAGMFGGSGPAFGGEAPPFGISRDFTG